MVDIESAAILLLCLMAILTAVLVALSCCSRLSKPIGAVVVGASPLPQWITRACVVGGYPFSLAPFATKPQFILVVAFTPMTIVRFPTPITLSSRRPALPMGGVFTDPIFRLPCVHALTATKLTILLLQFMGHATDVLATLIAWDDNLLIPAPGSPNPITFSATKRLIRFFHFTITPNHFLLAYCAGHDLSFYAALPKALQGAESPSISFNQALKALKCTAALLTYKRHLRAVSPLTGTITELVLTTLHKATETENDFPTSLACNLNLARSVTVPASPTTKGLFWFYGGWSSMKWFTTFRANKGLHSNAPTRDAGDLLRDRRNPCEGRHILYHTPAKAWRSLSALILTQTYCFGKLQPVRVR